MIKQFIVEEDDTITGWISDTIKLGLYKKGKRIACMRPKGGVSHCCKARMIPPDWEMAEQMGSLYSAFACYICTKCHKPCSPIL